MGGEAGMTDHDAFAERGRALEEEYFRKKDRELMEKMRRAAGEAEARRRMGEKTGLQDPELLAELQALGFTPDTVVLLPLVPLVQVAWAEGGVTPAERALIVKLARSRGIAESTEADRQLAAWLDENPGVEVFERAMRLVRAMVDVPAGGTLSADELVEQCERVAAASGGLFGINRISGEERVLLASIAADLKKRD